MLPAEATMITTLWLRVVLVFTFLLLAMLGFMGGISFALGKLWSLIQ